jgi:serine/threonine-protein kinase HipA
MSFEAFFRLFEDLPRGAPGSDAETLAALRALPAVPPRARVLDLGCGPGRSTLVLGRALEAPAITAVDLHAPWLARLEESARAAGIASRIMTRREDFGALSDAPGSIDLVWSEGAIYHLGFENGLRTWRPLLAEGAVAAVSELTWTTDDRSPEPRAFWNEAYPAMTTIARNVATAERAGFRVIGTRTLALASWWQEFYTPLRERIDGLRAEARTDADLALAIRAAEAEIALRERFAGEYAYVFYLLQRA